MKKIKKLALKKFTVASINNLNKIIGGTGDGDPIGGDDSQNLCHTVQVCNTQDPNDFQCQSFEPTCTTVTTDTVPTNAGTNHCNYSNGGC